MQLLNDAFDLPFFAVDECNQPNSIRTAGWHNGQVKVMRLGLMFVGGKAAVGMGCVEGTNTNFMPFQYSLCMKTELCILHL